ncbi:MAG: Arm DNA-binding domain-containing protein, partial [Acidobacteriota bacterium]
MPINKKITKAVVDAAVYDGAVRPLPNGRTAYGRHVIWDTEIKGFGVRVNPGGTKTYVYSYRNKWGKPRLKTIGKHGNITAEQARRMAKREAAAVVDGDDPLAERQAARNAPTVAEYFEAHYFKLHAVPGKLEAKTVQEQRYAIDKHVVSRFGDLPLPALGPEHVSRMHAEMAATPYAANRTLIYLSGALNLAERWGLRPEGSNPCADVTKYPEKGRKRTAGKDELARLAAALRTMEERAPLSPRANHRLYRQTAVAAIRLWLLTGARRGQVLKAKRTDYDRARGILWVEPKSNAASWPG